MGEFSRSAGRARRSSRLVRTALGRVGGRASFARRYAPSLPCSAPWAIKAASRGVAGVIDETGRGRRLEAFEFPPPAVHSSPKGAHSASGGHRQPRRLLAALGQLKRPGTQIGQSAGRSVQRWQYDARLPLIPGLTNSKTRKRRLRQTSRGRIVGRGRTASGLILRGRSDGRNLAFFDRRGKLDADRRTVLASLSRRRT